MKNDKNENKYYDENFDNLKKNNDLKNLTDELSKTHKNLNYAPDDPDLSSEKGQNNRHTEYGPGSDCVPYNKVLFHDYFMEGKNNQ